MPISFNRPGVSYQDRSNNKANNNDGSNKNTSNKKTVVDASKATSNGTRASTFRILGNKLKVDNLPPNGKITVSVRDPRASNGKRTLEFINNTNETITARLYFDKDGIYTQNPAKNPETKSTPLLDKKIDEKVSWKNNLASEISHEDLKELGVSKENSNDFNVFQSAAVDKLNKLQKALNRFENNDPVTSPRGKTKKPKNLVFKKIDNFLTLSSARNKKSTVTQKYAQNDVTSPLIKALHTAIKNDSVKVPKELGEKSKLLVKLSNLLRQLSRDGEISSKNNKSLLILANKILNHNQGLSTGSLPAPSQTTKKVPIQAEIEKPEPSKEKNQKPVASGKSPLLPSKNRSQIVDTLIDSAQKLKSQLEAKNIPNQALYDKLQAFINKLEIDDGSEGLVKLRQAFFELDIAAKQDSNAALISATKGQATPLPRQAVQQTIESDKSIRKESLEALTNSAIKLRSQLEVSQSPNNTLKTKIDSLIAKLQQDDGSEGLVKLKQTFFELNAEFAKEP